MLFRGLIDVTLATAEQRLIGVIMLLAFVALLLWVEALVGAGSQRVGRRLELRFRVSFLRKIPKLVDRYLQSRLTSDMAERCHGTHRLRAAAATGGLLVRAVAALLVTGAGIVWLDSSSLPGVSVAVLTLLLIPFGSYVLLAERELRVRTLAGSLGRLHLDALRGRSVIRAHGAGRPIRREHEGLVAQWARAGRGLQRAVVTVESLQLVVGYSVAMWILYNHVGHAAPLGAVLLLVYWALQLPTLGQDIAANVRHYPGYRSITLRLLEPLGALEQSVASPPIVNALEPPNAVSIELRRVSVCAAGQTVLRDIDVRINPGEHVAIVGSSGAGKSTLLALLLGWHRAASGELLVDGSPLDAGKLRRVRRQTAWVDPGVQLWNRTLLDNLRYGSDDCSAEIDVVLSEAGLQGMVGGISDGLQTRLGEGGGLISDGEGQRVRFGRALLRPEIRLAILDEPFRGLGRAEGRLLLDRARRRWLAATLLCVTHDVGDTLDFNRVMVMSNGGVVEFGDPRELAATEGSRFRAMLESERDLDRTSWGDSGWRRLWVSKGQVVSTP
jgi:ATP-binding cassette subfamily B protein